MPETEVRIEKTRRDFHVSFKGDSKDISARTGFPVEEVETLLEVTNAIYNRIVHGSSAIDKIRISAKELGLTEKEVLHHVFVMIYDDKHIHINGYSHHHPDQETVNDRSMRSSEIRRKIKDYLRNEAKEKDQS